jgi:hypothetical protein
MFSALKVLVVLFLVNRQYPVLIISVADMRKFESSTSASTSDNGIVLTNEHQEE